MKTWKKTELADEVANKTGQHKNATKIIINEFLNTVVEKVKDGDSVLLQKLCKFYSATVPEKEKFVYLPGVNRPSIIPTHIRMGCRIAKSVKNRLNS